MSVNDLRVVHVTTIVNNVLGVTRKIAIQKYGTRVVLMDILLLLACSYFSGPELGRFVVRSPSMLG